MKASRFFAIAFLYLTASSCIAIPLGTQVLRGKAISEEEVAFIKPGVTTKSQVLEYLGNPDIVWENERVLAYEWVRGTAWFVVAGGGRGGNGGTGFSYTAVLRPNPTG